MRAILVALVLLNTCMANTGAADAANRQAAVAPATGALHPQRGPAPDRRIERLWTVAAQHMRNDRPRAAIPYLERLVSLAPGDAEARASLGLALFRVEQDERAQFQLERALAGGLPPALVHRIEGHLDAIRARKSWQGSFSLAVAPESNAARRTSARDIWIGGARFKLDPEARAKSGAGLHLGGSVAYFPFVARDLRLNLGLSASARLFRTSSLNDVALRMEAGLIALRDRGTEWSGGLSLQRRWLGQSGLHWAPGIYAGHAARLDPVTRLSVRAEAERLEHDRYSDLDGTRLRLKASVTRLQAAHLSLRARAFASRLWARAPYESGTEMGIGFGASYAFSGGLTPSLDITYAHDRRDRRSPLFAERRREDRLEISLSLLHRAFQFRGFAPTLEIAYEIRRANIAIYDYETTRVSLGVTRRF